MLDPSENYRGCQKPYGACGHLPNPFKKPLRFLGKAVNACANFGFGTIGTVCGLAVALRVCATQGKRQCVIAAVSTATGAVVGGATARFAKRAIEQAVEQGHVGKGV